SHRGVIHRSATGVILVEVLLAGPLAVPEIESAASQSAAAGMVVAAIMTEVARQAHRADQTVCVVRRGGTVRGGVGSGRELIGGKNPFVAAVAHDVLDDVRRRGTVCEILARLVVVDDVVVEN